MGQVAVVDTEVEARLDRESFYDSHVSKRVRMRFGWPARLRFVGRGESVIYWSDKWGDRATYKHRREGARWDVYVVPSLRVGGQLPLGRVFDIVGPMPRHVAYLGKFRGLQLVNIQGRPVHMELSNAHWASARIPATGETVLVAYDARGVLVVVTGNDLAIEKDGIVG